VKLCEMVPQRGVPPHIRSDNGPEFVAKAVQAWTGASGSRAIFTTPGIPWENPYIESFSGKFRDECLNMEMFASGAEAKMIVEAWPKEYDQQSTQQPKGI